MLQETEMAYSQSTNLELIERFINSGYDLARVEFDRDKYNSPTTFASSINGSAKRFNKFGVRCIVKKGIPYLVRKGTV